MTGEALHAARNLPGTDGVVFEPPYRSACRRVFCPTRITRNSP